MVRVLPALLLFTFSLGCGGDKPTQARPTAKPVESKEDIPQAFPHEKSPAESVQASKSTAEKILKVHTNNEPALLEKMKSCRLVCDGIMSAGQGNDRPVKFEFQAIYPQSARYSALGLVPGVEFVYLRNNGTTIRKHDFGSAWDGELESTTRDMAGNWHLLLLTLADSESILAPGPEAYVDGIKCDSLRVWKKGLAPAILSYDPTTFVLKKVTYPGLYQNNREVLIEILIHDHGTSNGFKYPQRMSVRHAGSLLMTFVKTELEFPKEYAKDAFTKP